MPDTDAWKLCCWTVAAGKDWRSSVQEWSYTSNSKLSTSCAPESPALLAAPSWMPGPWQAWLGLLRAGWGLQASAT
eukprot:1159555-Pelagomonas_calceolata.AAC.17